MIPIMAVTLYAKIYSLAIPEHPVAQSFDPALPVPSMEVRWIK
jgi:hypothetical protein